MNLSLKQAYTDIMLKLGKTKEDAEVVTQEAETAEEKRQEALRAKGATDPMYTGNTGYGAEMVATYLYKDELYSMIARDKKSLISMLPGNHGEIHAPSALVSVKGRVNKFLKGSEFSSWTIFAGKQSNNAMITARVTLPIGKFNTMVVLTKEEIQYNTDASIFNTVQNAIVQGGVETITSVIINGDTESNTATGNVNQKDNGTGTALANQHRLTINLGLRKVAIANTIVGGAVAHDSNVYKQMLQTIGDYAAMPEDCIWLVSSKTGLSARYVPGYRTQQDKGNDATVNTPGTPAKIEGIEVLQTRELAKLVGVDGYVYEGTSETGATAKNLYGQMLLFYKPAVQFAFGHPMQTVVYETSDAFLIDVTMWFGFVVVNNVAGLDKTVAMWVVL